MTDTNAAEPRTYRIESYRMASLNARIEKIQAKAKKIAKHGALAATAESIGVTVVGHEQDYLCMNCDGSKLAGCSCWAPGPVREYTLVQVSGSAPRLAGWRFAAKIEHVSELGVNLIKAAPDLEGVDFTRFRDADVTCEHCKLRRTRRDTYVVAHEDGRLTQVGSSCLGDFLGAEGPTAAVLAEAWRSIGDACEEEESEGGGGGGGRQANKALLSGFLGLVVAAARKYGWVSRKMLSEREDLGMSTGSRAWDALFPFTAEGRKAAKELVASVTEADKAFAELAIAAAKEIPADVANDYEYNLRVVAAVTMIDARMMGLAASIYAWYRRKVEGERERASRPVSQHVGTVGERAERELILWKVSHFDSQFGTMHVHMFNDAAGNVLVWKTGSASLEEGTYSVKATVKAHSDYKGTLQTELTRCDCVEICGPVRQGEIVAVKKARKPAKAKAAKVDAP